MALNLLAYLQSLNYEERRSFAARCGTSLDYLWQIANAARTPKAQLAVRISRESSGVIPCEKLLPEVDWAYLRQQSGVRPS